MPGPFTTFPVFEPKHRLISAAPFPDRVVHHALINVVEFDFESFQVFHSYACRPGKGGHACVRQAYANQRRFGWFLRLDVRKFFESVSHERLRKLLRRRFRDPFLRSIFDRILASIPCGHGLPIGNLTSQHLANFYLAHLDHFVLQTLRPSAYVRYMDDFVLWGRSRAEVMAWHDQIRHWLRNELALELKVSATSIASVRQGLSFLGYRITPSQIRLGRRSLARYRRHLRRFRKVFSDTGDWERVRARWDAVHGYAGLAHIGGLRRGLLAEDLCCDEGQWTMEVRRPVPTG